MDDEIDEIDALRARVAKLEHVVGQLTWLLDGYLPRSRWFAPPDRYDRAARQHLDEVIRAVRT